MKRKPGIASTTPQRGATDSSLAPRALSRVVGAIDVGTNSVLLLVVRTQDDGIAEVLADASQITRLGEGVDRTGHLAAEPVARALAAASQFKQQAEALKAERLWAIATSAVREASNRAGFLERLRAEVGGEVELLSGEEEAERVFLGVQSNERFTSSSLLVMDVGGGSAELVLGASEGIQESMSLDIGCVRLTERFLEENPVGDDALGQAMEFAQAFLSPYLGRAQVRGRTMVATGGTATTLAAVDQGLTSYDREKVDGHPLAACRVDELLERLRRMDLETRKQVAGMPPKRADVIVAGTVIYCAALHVWGIEELTVSDRGLRFGTILKRLAENY